MRIKSITSIIYCSLLSTFCQAQTISGVVLDSLSKSSLPFANVFINNTAYGTITDNSGKFRLSNLTPGTYELVISFVGYKSFSGFLNLTPGIGELNLGTIQLTPSVEELGTIEVNGDRDKDWEKKFKKFTDVFLGKSKNSKLCVIENPWVLDFYEDNDQSGFFAKVSAPISVINKALGYRIHYHLKSFWYNDGEYRINGNVRFEEMNAETKDQTLVWRMNRIVTYKNSFNHLFKSILDQKTQQEGYKFYEIHKNSFSDEIEIEKIKKPDSIKIIESNEHKGEFRVFLKGTIQIEQRDKKALRVSRIHLTTNYASVNRNGFVLNSEALSVEGAYSDDRIPELLPINYDINSSIANEKIDTDSFLKFQEKLYLHTDKPHYYPGETIWFKGYIKYGNPLWRDSLSRVVYVELINPLSEIETTKTIEIDSGYLYNDLK